MLAKESIKTLFYKYKNGDYQAREEIILNNIPLVKFIVEKEFNNIKKLHSDLIQVGTIGLIKAVDTYDLNRNIEFSTYAYKVILNEIRKNLNNLLNKEISLDENNQLYDLLIDDINIEEEYEIKEFLQNLKNIINKLPDEIQTIIKMYYGLDGYKKYTQKEIGQIYSLKKSNLSIKIKLCLDLIKWKLEQMDYVNNEKKI